MSDYDEITERVEAMGHTQKAIDILGSLTIKTPQTIGMRQDLEAVRKELAYEIFRSES